MFHMFLTTDSGALPGRSVARTGAQSGGRRFHLQQKNKLFYLIRENVRGLKRTIH